MRLFHLILLILGALCFVVEFYQQTRPQRTWKANIAILGLLCWIVVPLSTVIQSYNN